MDYKEQLTQDLHQAMKENNTLNKRVIRLLLSSIQLLEVGKGKDLDYSEFLAAVQKEIKTKHDTIADAKLANRTEMIAEAEAEIKVLEAYLPTQLSEKELLDIVRGCISEVNANSIKDMGNVMKVLLPKLAGRATNQEASRIVKECLQPKS